MSGAERITTWHQGRVAFEVEFVEVHLKETAAFDMNHDRKSPNWRQGLRHPVNGVTDIDDPHEVPENADSVASIELQSSVLTPFPK